MKIQIISDLHFDFDENYNFFIQNFKSTGDILIIAGDTCHYNSKFRDAYTDFFLKNYPITIEVPGNHDNYDSKDSWYKNFNYNKQYNSNNYYYLNNNVVEISNIRFICSTLWSHIYHEISYIPRTINDYHLIFGYNINKNNDRFYECKRFIENTLENTPDNMKVVIITHHLPLLQLVSEKFKFNRANEAFASDLSSIIAKYDKKINYWIHGHSHDFKELNFMYIKFIRNPLGYLCLYENKNVNLGYTIEV